PYRAHYSAQLSASFRTGATKGEPPAVRPRVEAARRELQRDTANDCAFRFSLARCLNSWPYGRRLARSASTSLRIRHQNLLARHAADLVEAAVDDEVGEFRGGAEVAVARTL